jgi:hypothetical protein
MGQVEESHDAKANHKKMLARGEMKQAKGAGKGRDKVGDWRDKSDDPDKAREERGTILGKQERTKTGNDRRENGHKRNEPK